MKKILKNLAAAAMLGLVFCTGVTSHASNGNVVLVLDPGHDVHDAGARRTWNGVTYAEETITLKMAQYCKEELEKYSGIVVYMTRFSNNVDMDRYDRVKVAKDLGADALVSLHINSTGNQQDTVSGALAYVPISSNKADYAVEARALAADIVSNLSTVGMKNLGYLKGEGLGIIYYGRQWKIPTMIIEHGFVNNPSDCLKYYGSDAKIKAVAVADATAIARHYGITKMRGWNQIGDEWIYLDKNGNKKTGWITDAGKEYYLDEEGHKVSGFVKINDKKYYFNEKGIQQNGWQKIKGDYYFFQIRNGCYASMVTSRRVNGIYLTKSGEARYNSEEKRKLNLMVTANQVMRRVTKRNMSKPEKLWRCYLKAVSYGYGGTGNDYDFRYYYSNWDVSYAEDMFYRGHGDCFAFASAFAYLANAVGFEAKVISSGGHGWAEIKGEVCDPNWAKGTGHIERYYRMSYDLSGVDGRPYYRGNRAYVITI